MPYFTLYELRHTFATRLSAGGVVDHMVTQMLRQGDAEVFKLYSQAKLGMMREALAKLNERLPISARGIPAESFYSHFSHGRYEPRLRVKEAPIAKKNLCEEFGVADGI